MAKPKTKIKEEKAKKPTAKELVVELEHLFLNEKGNELSEKGIYYRLMPSLHVLGGSIDKTTPLVARIKDIILELKKVV